MTKARQVARFVSKLTANGEVGSTALQSSGVVGGSYGSGTSLARFTVDQDGRLTAASETPITIDSSQVQGNLVTRVNSVVVTTSDYTATNDTAVSTSGGYVKILGENFGAVVTVLIGSVPATSVARWSSSELRCQIPAQAEGSYTVYITDVTTGRISILLNGIIYSAFPVWQTSPTLPAVNSLVQMNLQLLATNSINFALAVGSTLPTGLTLTSAGLLSGAINTAVTTTYTFTIVATDAQNQDVPQTFTITIYNLDLYWHNTVTLITGQYPDKVVSYDYSGNNWQDRTIWNPTSTNNRHPLAKRHTPFQRNWSGYFDGSSMYQTVNHATSLNLTTDAWTIEFWIMMTYYPNGTSGGANKYIIHKAPAASAGWQIGFDNVGRLHFQDFVTGTTYYFNSTSPHISSSYYRFLPGIWYHVAFVKEHGAANGFNCYVDGQLKNSYANSTSFTNTDNLVIGRDRAGTNYFAGWLHNMRISNVARYTATFTPPVDKFTHDPYTLFLNFHKNRYDTKPVFQDQGLTITNNVPPLMLHEGPEYEAPSSDYGSLYTEGHGIAVVDTTFANSSIKLGAGAWTIEGWALLQSTAGSIISKGTAATNGWEVSVDSSDNLIFSYLSSTVTTSGSIINFSRQGWHHWAVVKEIVDGTNSRIKLFVDGILGVTSTNITNTSLTFTADNSIMKIGRSRADGNEWDGYIHDIRISNAAMYTANYAIPTTQLSITSNVMYSSMRGIGQLRDVIEDEGPHQRHLISGTTEHRLWNSSAFSFRTGFSGKFYNGDESLVFTDSGNYDFSNNINFTIDAFFQDHRNPDDAAVRYIFRCQAASTDNDGYYLYCTRDSSNGKTYVNFGVGDRDGWQAQSIRFGAEIAFNDWNWVVIQRIGNKTAFYFNGTKTAEIDSPFYVNCTTGPVIGESWYGLLSNIRWQRNEAYYAVNGANPASISWPTVDLANARLPTNANTVFFAFGHPQHPGNWNATASANDVYISSMGPFYPTATYNNQIDDGISWNTYDDNDQPYMPRSSRLFHYLHQHGTSWTAEGYFWGHLDTSRTVWRTGDSTAHAGLAMYINTDGTTAGRGRGAFALSYQTARWVPGNSSNNYTPQGWTHFVICFDIQPSGSGPRYAMFFNGTRITLNDWSPAGASQTSSEDLRFYNHVPVCHMRISRAARYDVNNATLTLRNPATITKPYAFPVGNILNTAYTGNNPTGTTVYDKFDSVFWKGRGMIFRNQAETSGRMMYGVMLPSYGIKKWGECSMYFPGTWNTTGSSAVNHYIRIDRNNWRDGYQLRRQNFTVEMWVSCEAATSVAAANMTVWDLQDVIRLQVNAAGNWSLDQSGTVRIDSGIACSLNGVFQHICLTRENETYKLYVDFVLRGSFASNGVAVSGNRDDWYDGYASRSADYQHLGNRLSASQTYQFRGWVQDFRITNGVARYVTATNSNGEPALHLGTTTPVNITQAFNDY
jgi:hypothetical protein